MKLADILRAEPGQYVWPFARLTGITTIADAHRRVQAAIARPPHDTVKVECQGVVMTDTSTYQSEPALIIEIKRK
jgi:hypothetical protein